MYFCTSDNLVIAWQHRGIWQTLPSFLMFYNFFTRLKAREINCRIWDLENISLVIRQKSESQSECYMKTKHVKFSKKTNISCKHFIYLPPDTHFFHDITYWCYSSLLNQVKACQECAFDAHLLANLYPEKVLNIRLYNVVI